MYQHVCTGAECPACGVFGIQLSSGKPWRPGVLWDLIEDRRSRLATFTDGRGEGVQQWPKGPWPRPSTTVIIPHGSHWQDGAPWVVLCQQRTDNGWWGFPGGGQEIGESLQECAMRETYEETGLQIYLYGMVCADSDPHHYGICAYPDGTVQYSNTTFLAGIRSGTLQVSVESQQLGWFSTDLLPIPFLRNHQWRLEQAMAHRGPFLPQR